MNNCITYALPKYWNEGGILMFRRARVLETFGMRVTKWNPFFWVPHVGHMSCSGRIAQYSPTLASRKRHKEDGILKFWIHLWHFEGHVEEMEVAEFWWGDDVPTLEVTP
ncbi:MAG: hypothetical protein U5L11_02455 [Arhodomonas sp.]|nr:hypothetical protein [Arhodomonas sp.]